jgi:hypothetical protein
VPGKAAAGGTYMRTLGKSPRKKPQMLLFFQIFDIHPLFSADR